MTAYFDNVRREIDATLRRPEHEQWDALLEIDRALIRDCSRAVVSPGFPTELVEPALDIMNRWSVAVQVDDGLHSREWSPETERIGDNAGYASVLRNLETGLHSIWHHVARLTREAAADGIGWGDCPLTPMWALEVQAETMRQQRREARLAHTELSGGG